jgi:hypothetical protein
MGCGDVRMIKLKDIYDHKYCPIKPTGYVCEGNKCAKFISCMVDEIDALNVIGVNSAEINDLDNELYKMVDVNANNNC